MFAYVSLYLNGINLFSPQAKLKSHIHDPNAPELVHFLFTPLALIVDASRDSNYGPNLPAKVMKLLNCKNR